MAWDYLITVQDEWELIWFRSWNFVSLLFVVTRYAMFVDVGFATLARQFWSHPTDTLCKGLDDMTLYVNICAIFIAEGVLIVRMYAMWNQNRRIAWIFGGFLFCLAVATFGYISKAITFQEYAPSPSPSAFPGCFLIGADRQVWIGQLVATLFEAAIVITTLYKAVLQWRYGGSQSSLLKTITRDGLIFFILLISVSLLNIVIINVAPPALAFMFTSIYRVLHSLLTERIILNIRSAALKKVHYTGTDDTPGPLSLTNPTVPEFRVRKNKSGPGDSMEMKSFPTTSGQTMRSSEGDTSSFLALAE